MAGWPLLLAGSSLMTGGVPVVSAVASSDQGPTSPPDWASVTPRTQTAYLRPGASFSV